MEMPLLALGYSIHNVLDEIATLNVWCRTHEHGAEVAAAMTPLGEAGRHLARIMQELTK